LGLFTFAFPSLGLFKKVIGQRLLLPVPSLGLFTIAFANAKEKVLGQGLLFTIPLLFTIAKQRQKGKAQAKGKGNAKAGGNVYLLNY
jgi:hypothetical protein